MLHGVVEAQTRTRPNAPALAYRERIWTFGELDACANAYANVLCDAGVTHGSLVAVALERIPESVAVLYGIAKLGAAFVPLDPLAPEARLRQILADARPALVIAAANYAPALRAIDASLLSLDDLMLQAERVSSTFAPGIVRPNDLAYVMYTSGSTGQPKGVMIEHRSVTNTLRCVRDVFGYTATDRVYQMAAWSFDPSVLQIFGSLSAGACVVLNSTGNAVDFATIVDEIVDQGVTVFDSVPGLLGPLLDREHIAESALRLLGVGGAIARGSLRDRAYERLGLPVCNHYGPTETSILATVYVTSPSDTDDRLPIGTPIDGTLAYILDADGRPVEPGADGELYIGGRGVARGYLRRPEMTADRFLADPFVADAQARMYRTGDAVRLRDDGNLEFLGRLDDQVKIRGVRIELQELELVLDAHPNVARAAAVVEGDEGNERLIAYVEPHTKDARLVADLMAQTRAALPAAARPARVEIVDSMPMLTSGKIDRTALRAAFELPSAVRSSPGFDTLNDAIARIWADVLGRNDIGLHDDFFAVGGNSLAAARCAAQIEAQFGRRIAIAVLFADPTIAGLGNVLRTKERMALAPIVRIASGTKEPLFYLHGDYTGVGLYVRRFAGALDESRPIYALPPHGADGGAVPKTLEAMAAKHVAAIRKVKPAGPYLLGGYCMGGIVALEMARQFRASGDRVTHVLALDAHQIVPRSGLRRLLSMVRRYSAWGRPEWGEDDAFGDLDPATSHVAPAQHRAVLSHSWGTIDAPVTMLCSEDGRSDDLIEKQWTKYIPELTVRRIAGEHTTALTDHVDVTCGTIADVLRRVDD